MNFILARPLYCFSPVMLDNNVSPALAASWRGANVLNVWSITLTDFRSIELQIRSRRGQCKLRLFSIFRKRVCLCPNTVQINVVGCEINCLGTSPSLWPRAPRSVTTATEGEGTGRCSAHAQYSREGQFLVQWQQMSVTQMLKETQNRVARFPNQMWRNIKTVQLCEVGLTVALLSLCH